MIMFYKHMLIFYIIFDKLANIICNKNICNIDSDIEKYRKCIIV
jgi:hypothetical protein